MSKKGYEVPFYEDGSIPNYVTGYVREDGVIEVYDYEKRQWGHRTVTWKDPEPFNAVLQLDHVEHGRGRLSVVWRNVLTGAGYTMTGTEFNKLVKKAEWAGPLLIDGLWRPVKRGSNFNVQYVPTEEAE